MLPQDWKNFRFANGPRPPFNKAGIEKDVLDIINGKGCKDFAKTILDKLAQTRGGLGTLVEVATKFFAQSGQLFTRNRPPGSEGNGNPIGRIAEDTGQIYVNGIFPNNPNSQLSTDIDTTISELFHLAAQVNITQTRSLLQLFLSRRTRLTLIQKSELVTCHSLIRARTHLTHVTFLIQKIEINPWLTPGIFIQFSISTALVKPGTTRGVPFQGR